MQLVAIAVSGSYGGKQIHIPDGYLSPATAGAMYAATVPFWYVASRKVRQTLTHRTVPALALFAAFAFVLQMFNIPLPGGTTGHAVGGTLLAIIVGPWAAVLGISVVMIIQAFFFGDGGILALGANSFNMAIVLPLVGYLVYRAIGSGSGVNSSRRLVAAVLASYVAINVSALLTGIELGLQPVLFHASDGTSLYNPYGLAQALPVMLAGHLLVAGPVEALATGLVFVYVRRYQPELLGKEAGRTSGSRLWIIWAGLGALALAAPVGLLASGTAWGEWSLKELNDMGLGFIPGGMERFEGWWPAPMPGYGWSRLGAVTAYILSALVGMVLVIFFSWFLARRLRPKSPGNPDPGPGRTKAGKGFLQKNISGITGMLESALFSEQTSRARGLLQGLDARVKTVTLLLFIVVVSLERSLAVLAGIYLLTLILAVTSHISLISFTRRCLLFVSFTALIALPALFVVSGERVVLFGSSTPVTEQGARVAGLLVLRVLDSISLASLLVLTTPWTRLLVTFRWLRFPSLLVAILGMTYRYIFLLLHTANSMFLARRSRAVGKLSGRDQRRFLGRALTTTLAKSHHLSEEVYLAMLSRGYRGEMMSLDRFTLRKVDLAWGIFCLGLATIIIWSNAL